MLAGTTIQKDPWIQEGLAYTVGPETVIPHVLRCTAHDDCREVREVGYACEAARWEAEIRSTEQKEGT